MLTEKEKKTCPLPSFLRRQRAHNTYGFRWEIAIDGCWLSVVQAAQLLDISPRLLRLRITRSLKTPWMSIETFLRPVAQWFASEEEQKGAPAAMDLPYFADHDRPIPWSLLEHASSRLI